MATNVIPGGEIFSFTVGGRVLELHGQLQQLQSTDEQDVATHRIIKRDGAIKEGMGWRDRTFTAQLYFVGPNFRAELTAVHAAIRANSEGILNHPIYGRVTARCTKFEDTLDVVAAANGAAVQVRFEETGLDASVMASPSQGVPAKAQALSAAYEALVAAADYFSAAVAAVLELGGLVQAFAGATMDAAAGTPDPSLPAQLDAIGSATSATIDAIQSDPVADEDVDRFEAVSAAELVYAAAIDLSDALAASRPAPMLYTVPAPISYLMLAAQFYGAEGLTRADEILVNNPQVSTPHLIPAGTVLVMAAPTV